MSPALATFLFQAANFLVLAAALGWFLFKPVRAALDAERDRHAQAEEQVVALRREAETRQREASEARGKLATEIEQQRAALLSAAESDAARIKEEARRVQVEQQRLLQRDSGAAQRARSAQLAETLGRIAAASVRRLLETLDGPSLDAALLRAAHKEIAALPVEARRAAVVESARPLEAPSREQLSSLLGEGFVERLAPDLGAGVRVTTPQGQVDASALALAREIAREVTEAANVPRELEEERGGGDG